MWSGPEEQRQLNPPYVKCVACYIPKLSLFLVSDGLTLYCVTCDCVGVFSVKCSRYWRDDVPPLQRHMGWYFCLWRMATKWAALSVSSWHFNETSEATRALRAVRWLVADVRTVSIFNSISSYSFKHDRSFRVIAHFWCHLRPGEGLFPNEGSLRVLDAPRGFLLLVVCWALVYHQSGSHCFTSFVCEEQVLRKTWAASNTLQEWGARINVWSCFHNKIE